jgi:hypothetical protein
MASSGIVGAKGAGAPATSQNNQKQHPTDEKHHALPQKYGYIARQPGINIVMDSTRTSGGSLNGNLLTIPICVHRLRTCPYSNCGAFPNSAPGVHTIKRRPTINSAIPPKPTVHWVKEWDNYFIGNSKPTALMIRKERIKMCNNYLIP